MLFVDDTVLVPKSVENLHTLVLEFWTVYQRRKLKVNDKNEVERKWLNDIDMKRIGILEEKVET